MKKKAAVGVGYLAEHGVTDDRGAVFDPGCCHDQLFRLIGYLARALQGRGIGQLNAAKDVTLVLLRKKSRGDNLAKKAGHRNHADQKKQADQTLAYGKAADADIAIGRTAEHPVKPVVKFLQQAGPFDFRLEQQGAEGRAQRQGVEGAR